MTKIVVNGTIGFNQNDFTPSGNWANGGVNVKLGKERESVNLSPHDHGEWYYTIINIIETVVRNRKQLDKFKWTAIEFDLYIDTHEEYMMVSYLRSHTFTIHQFRTL